MKMSQSHSQKVFRTEKPGSESTDFYRVPYFDSKKKMYMSDGKIPSTDYNVESVNSTTQIVLISLTLVAWLIGLAAFYLTGKKKGRNKGTDYIETIPTVMNTYIDIGLWALPYSVYLGGVLALPIIVGICALCYYTSYRPYGYRRC